MGASTREKGVLKLVHPGRHVEYHRKPITAGEIMKKNPRHSITRPDFFKNPNIVVRPESVMVPGQVFYIVPNMTVHRLVKHKNQQLNGSSIESPKQTSSCKLWAGRTPMNQFYHEQEGSSLGAKSRPEPEETPSDDSLTVTLAFQAKYYYLNRDKSAWGITKDYSQQETESKKKDKNLKSCMKKDNGIRGSNLRVTFAF